MAVETREKIKACRREKKNPGEKKPGTLPVIFLSIESKT